MTGMSRDEIDRVGGVTPAEEEPTDVQAAFEAGGKGETGQPTALVTVDLADLLTALNQRTGHSHTRPGVWDASNPPWRANLPCVECAARERLRAALATALEQAQPLLVADGLEVESLEPLPPYDPDAPLELRERPGTGRPMGAIEGIPDGVEREYVLGQERSEEEWAVRRDHEGNGTHWVSEPFYRREHAEALLASMNGGGDPMYVVSRRIQAGPWQSTVLSDDSSEVGDRG